MSLLSEVRATELVFALAGLGAVAYVTGTFVTDDGPRLRRRVSANYPPLPVASTARRRSTIVGSADDDVTRRRSSDAGPVAVPMSLPPPEQRATFEFDEDLDGWRTHVRDRIHTTFAYLGGTAVLTGISTVAACRSPKLQSMCYGWEPVAFFGGMVIVFLSTSVVVLVPYEPGTFGLKQLAWLLNCGLTGIALTPLCRFAGSSIVRSAILTTGTVGGLSAIGMMARNEQFLMVAGPMALTFGAVAASAVGLSVYPKGTEVGNMLNDVNMNVMFILFSLTLLYDVHNLVKEAETIPPDFRRDRHGIAPFDPIRHAVALFNSVLGIFIRVLYFVVNDEAERRRREQLEEEQRRLDLEQQEARRQQVEQQRRKGGILGRLRRGSAGELHYSQDASPADDTVAVVGTHAREDNTLSRRRRVAAVNDDVDEEAAAVMRRVSAGVSRRGRRRTSSSKRPATTECACCACLTQTALLRWRLAAYFAPSLVFRRFAY